MKILVTGSNGFIGGYLVENLLANNHQVIGIDNFSKYGKVIKSYDNHPNFQLIQGDCKNTDLILDAAKDCDQIVACAAMIGGISYFHEYAYDLLAENDRIIASTFDAAIKLFKLSKLQKINVLSSSMVFENAISFPSKEQDTFTNPPPSSTYGFQKLACEYYAKGAFEQYKLPYTIIRPFNCIGIGEKKALLTSNKTSGNIKLAMSHVVPDLIYKVLAKQDPLHILGSGKQVRCYTYGEDIAEGIRLCIEKPEALNEDFNISTSQQTSVLELAKLIWDKINTDQPFNYISDEAFKYDVQYRVPDTSKANRLLGFQAQTDLSAALDKVIPYIQYEYISNMLDNFEAEYQANHR